MKSVVTILYCFKTHNLTNNQPKRQGNGLVFVMMYVAIKKKVGNKTKENNNIKIIILSE